MDDQKHKIDWWWHAPEYFSRWRLFPRAFITMYIYLLYRVVEWFMALPDPNMNQAGLVSVVVGAGAAWFGLYVNSVSSSGKGQESPMMRIETSTSNTTSFGNQPVAAPAPVKQEVPAEAPKAAPSKPSRGKFDVK